MPTATSDIKMGFFLMVGILLAVFVLGFVARIIVK
jgi:hypothetical protein